MVSDQFISVSTQRRPLGTNTHLGGRRTTDPVFYLHHAQIDHLWWQWQQENRSKRIYEYTGKQTKTATSDDASLDKLLRYGGFVDDIPVRQVMDTEGGFLCYRY